MIVCSSVDPFTKKEWYDVKAPSMFNIRQVGKTLVSRTVGTKIAADGLRGRVYEVSLADLQNDEIAYRKFKLICDEVQGKNCLTNFYGESSVNLYSWKIPVGSRHTNGGLSHFDIVFAPNRVLLLSVILFLKHISIGCSQQDTAQAVVE